MPTITNLQVNIIASGVGAPHGPLTKVTDMSTLPTPNENHSIEFTTALGDTAYMSYEQLSTAAVRTRILEQSSGVEARVARIKAGVAAMYAVTNAFSSPHTYADLVAAIAAVRANDDWLAGYY